MFTTRNLIVFGGAGALFLGVAVVNEIDKNLNYSEAMARVTAVETECILEKREGKVRTYTDPMPCVIARRARKSHPDYAGKGFEVKESGRTSFQYYGPDGAILNGSLKVLRDPNNCRLEVGSELRILVHKEDPTKVREADLDASRTVCSRLS